MAGTLWAIEASSASASRGISNWLWERGTLVTHVAAEISMRKQAYIIQQDIYGDIVGAELANKLTHPGEQLPVGVSRPEELQYLPGGQEIHWSLLDRPNWPLKVPTGQGKLTPDSEPV